MRTPDLVRQGLNYDGLLITELVSITRVLYPGHAGVLGNESVDVLEMSGVPHT